MSFYQTLQQSTETERNHLLSAPLIQRALSGEITPALYQAFLTQAYHHVRFTVPLLMSCGSKLSAEQEWLRKAIAEYIDEEYGHEQWILSDIEHAGGDKRTAAASIPSPATELMVSYAFDSIERVSPLAFFGMVQVLEGTSVALATQAADKIKDSLQLPEKAFSYLYSHGSLDQDHIEFFAGLMNQIIDENDQKIIIHAAKMFYRLYGDIFRSLTVLNTVANPTPNDALAEAV
ncbi:TenA family transcriptional regulator [Pelagibaculum spongiae]|uniref:Biliverdin-producing heme oxygenase n=1 Tax=Pelagibaculum spongiae TaxID=2080658 RepID=A0A2V1GWD3_9GAMM|nr:iron-containing redox enzyme family protein [Pelagibaculum spongiae]PVZ65400.1 biliverdin-producing heme oxygenase [Pelagibaculum spongiae]